MLKIKKPLQKMEIENIKDVSTIATPFTKVILESYIVPKIKDIKEKWNKNKKNLDESIESKFLDYLNSTYEKNAVLNTIAFKQKQVLLNEVYIPLKLHCNEDRKEFKIVDFTDEIFSYSDKILITDTAGMGKSTLSRKLVISCIEKNGGVPVLIELRRLSKSKNIIDEILEQLNPINEIFDKQFILDVIKKGDFIFFLDGFDEISLSERSFVTIEIQKFISKANKCRFILTSRPEDALSAFGDFQKFQIKPLEPSEAFQLIRKYDSSGKISKLLIEKLNEDEIFKNIKEYLATPLLVSLLYTAFEHKQSIPFKKHNFYRQVFEALFESHDLSKGDSFEREKFSGLSQDEFHRVLRVLGFFCLQAENKIEFSIDELNLFIKKSIDYCSNIDAKPSEFIKDLIITVPLFTKDGNYYKWSHKSLQEYFAALFVFYDTKERQKEILLHICFHNENRTFLNVIDLYRSIDPLGFEQMTTYRFINDYLNYLENSYTNFHGPEKLMRQQLTFGHEIFLINFPFLPETKENDPGKIFTLLSEHVKLKQGVSIIIKAVEDENSINCIKVPEIRNQV